MAKILGIDHVGIGVKNMDVMKKFYRGILKFTEIFGEFPEGVHEGLNQLWRATPTIHSGIQVNQKCGGIAVAMFHHVYPQPRPIRRDFRYGDIGIAKITMAVADLNHFYSEYQGKLNFCSQIRRIKIPGLGDYAFSYAKDPEGNLIEFIDGKKLSVKQKFGGVRWVGISVTDLERSVDFYQKHFGFDQTVVKIHESFSGNVDEICGSPQAQIRSCLLGNSRGNSMLELFEAIKPRGRSIPFSTSMVDFGYQKFCLLGEDIQEIEKYILQEDLWLLLPPQFMGSADPKNVGLAFLYTMDPDGMPVEVMVLPK